MTSHGVLKKYGVDAVERANQVRDLYNQQKTDKEEEKRNNKKNR